ncbi:hypothetical protein AB0M20_00390 [Actinoplanes sp. NPDC051633]|uniref:hypothetical protein n=1 Tax=Actinoplanes sp. NPDC051633 TaxID=3155670 RepID=UPI00341D9924
MEDPAVRLRKVVGKFVLLLAGVWVIVLVAGVVLLASSDAEVNPLSWAMILLPGCALVPGAVISLRLLRSDDPEQVSSLWVKSAIYGVAGLVIGIGSFVAIAQMQNGAS